MCSACDAFLNGVRWTEENSPGLSLSVCRTTKTPGVSAEHHQSAAHTHTHTQSRGPQTTSYHDTYLLLYWHQDPGQVCSVARSVSSGECVTLRVKTGSSLVITSREERGGGRRALIHWAWMSTNCVSKYQCFGLANDKNTHKQADKLHYPTQKDVGLEPTLSFLWA